MTKQHPADSSKLALICAVFLIALALATTAIPLHSAAEPSPTPSPTLDKVAVVQAQLDEVNGKLAQAQTLMQGLQQQRNQLGAQLLDLQLQVGILQQENASLKKAATPTPTPTPEPSPKK